MPEDKTERRQFKRVPVSFIVVYKVHEPLSIRMFIQDKEVYAVMLDLSEGGMAVLTTYDIPIWGILAIRFTLIDTSAPGDYRVSTIELQGEVRYNILQQENTYRLGIRFTQISENSRFVISNFCRKISFQGNSSEPK